MSLPVFLRGTHIQQDRSLGRMVFLNSLIDVRSH